MSYEDIFKGMDLDDDLEKGGAAGALSRGKKKRKRKGTPCGAEELGNEMDAKAGKKAKTGSTQSSSRGGGNPHPSKSNHTIEKSDSLFPINRNFSLVSYSGGADVSLSKSIESGNLTVPSARNLAMEQESERLGIKKALPFAEEEAEAEAIDDTDVDS